MRARACVFVDGENLRHSLMDAFAKDEEFRPKDYLPAEARWGEFFDWVVAAATDDTHYRLRAYWCVIQELECFPFELGQLGKVENRKQLKHVLFKHWPFRQQLRNLNEWELTAEMEAILNQLKDGQRRIESQFKHWIRLQNAIAIKHRAVEFRRAGTIIFNLFEKEFGKEKAVDVRLACDMLLLRDVYDTAIIVSGDQDYVPAAQALKDAGKTVINVAFEKRNGDLLPGGARRLNVTTDASVRVPYLQLRSFMGLDTPTSTPATAPLRIAAEATS